MKPILKREAKHTCQVFERLEKNKSLINSNKFEQMTPSTETKDINSLILTVVTGFGLEKVVVEQLTLNYSIV